VSVRALAALLAFGFTFGTAETINFDRARPNSFPTGWTITGSRSASLPRWKIEIDRTAPSRPHVLAPVRTRSGRHEASVALFDKSHCRDGEVSVDVKLVSGSEDPAAGVVWRFRDPGNYYFALVSADKDHVAIYRRLNNEVSPVASAAIPHRVEEDAWNLLRVVFRGPNFTLYFGHRKLLQAQDSRLADAGRMGVWIQKDTLAYFDNFGLQRRD
jgi:hypothetical protein